MSIFNKIPWTILLIAYVLVAYYFRVDMDGIPGYVFIGLGVFVLFAEFFKSGDISTGVFLADIINATIAVVLATSLICYVLFYPHEAELKLTFFHWFGYAIIIGDAILSPFNSFRTALRNFGVGGSGG
jgi:hypothetical protein